MFLLLLLVSAAAWFLFSVVISINTKCIFQSRNKLKAIYTHICGCVCMSKRTKVITQIGNVPLPVNYRLCTDQHKFPFFLHARTHMCAAAALSGCPFFWSHGTVEKWNCSFLLLALDKCDISVCVRALNSFFSRCHYRSAIIVSTFSISFYLFFFISVVCVLIFLISF